MHGHAHDWIRHEDPHLLVVAKPAGLTARTVADLVATRVARCWLLALSPPPDTSGLAVFVRTSAHRAAVEAQASDRRLTATISEVRARFSPSRGITLPARFRHAPELRLVHPVTHAVLHLTAPPPASHAAATRNLPAAHLAVLCAHDRRSPLHGSGDTNAYRLANGASDGIPDHLIDRLDDTILIGHRGTLDPALLPALAPLGAARVYAKQLRRDVRSTARTRATPYLLTGQPAPSRFPIRENGLTYLASLEEGYSTGLFLDQRDTRHFLRLHARAGAEVLNVFAYTCAFSVAAAAAGARTTSLDLSKRYLDWGRDNFRANALDPVAHDWIFGDAFDWLGRLARKQRRFGVVILDPPTFSTAKASGAWSAERDYGRLARLAIPLVAPGGLLICATNAASLPPSQFAETLAGAVRSSARTATGITTSTQPFDFPASPAEPAYLKVWRARL